ncbi:MAG TPA: sugar phosphate nucleotidyltransferase [Micromonosporaceae bacterium]|nr:sugar phosphate nucleotidyltransferase [Micromonosporaceae bacterium]
MSGASEPVGSSSSLCAVVLAAGDGVRLRPLTADTPKALCPVGNVPLIDRALATVAALGYTGHQTVAVNAWSHASQIVAHVGGRSHVSVEHGPHPLGSAGGLGALRPWIAGRDVLVANADAYLYGGDIAALLDGWDGRQVRLLGVPAGDRTPEFGAYRFAGVSVLPGYLVDALAAEPADLVRAVWRPAEAVGALTVVDYRGTYLDSGTPRDYLAANLDAASHAPGGCIVDPDANVTGSVKNSVVGAGATVAGSIERTVVWPGSMVGPDERLTDVIRYGANGTVDTQAPS